MDTGEKYQAQARMLANRVKKRYRHLHKRYHKQDLDVFRLYDWDIPEIRAVVDWYGGHLVVGEYKRRQSTSDWLPLMGEAAAKALDVPMARLHLKERKAGIKEGTRYRRVNHTNRLIPMRERDLRFYVNLDDYVDTGLFSDHRNTRKMVGALARGKDFLNLYCYTGAFTCYAARGGAASTVSVDRSETAVNWARQNLELNRLSGDRHSLIQADTLDFLDRTRSQGRSFDLAVVDPPSYSTTRLTESRFDIARDHPLLLKKAIRLMRPGSRLFFSTNHQNFELKSLGIDPQQITEITGKTIPEDYINKRKQIHRCWEIRL